MDDEREIEELLRRTLRKPLPLPEGFAERVAGQVRRQRMAWIQARMRRAVAAVLVAGLVLGFAGGWWSRQHEQRADAARRLALALAITDNTLRSIGSGLNERLQQVDIRRSTELRGARK